MVYDDGSATGSAASPDLVPPFVADPLFVEAVDAAIVGEPLVDASEAQPEREIDPRDFPSLYIRYRSPLQLHARRFLNDPHDIEDVVQETFIKLFLAAPDLHTELQALAFARRVLTNLCIDRYRAGKRRPAVINLDQGAVEELFADDEPVDPVVQAEDAAVVRQALALLSPLHRAALVKREVEEKPLPVIAAELGVAEESVKHLLFRARRALRRLLVGSAVDPQAPVEQLTVKAAFAAAPRRALAAATTALVLVAFVLAAVTGVGQRGHSPTVSEAGAPVIGGGAPPPATGTGHHGHRSGGHHSGAATAAHGSATSDTASQPSASTAGSPLSTGGKPIHRRDPGRGNQPSGPTHRKPPPSKPPTDPPPNPAPGTASRNYHVRGSVVPTGPVTIANQGRINYGGAATTSVSQLTAPVGAASFVLGQALVSPSGNAPQMQLDPQIQQSSEAPVSLAVTDSATTVALDTDSITYSVDVTATLAAGQAAAGDASLSAHLVYDASMRHILAETVTVTGLDVSSAVSSSSDGATPQNSPGSSDPDPLDKTPGSAQGDPSLPSSF
jgi:RNA polymerase sigma factor (sigma-70 family)